MSCICHTRWHRRQAPNHWVGERGRPAEEVAGGMPEMAPRSEGAVTSQPTRRAFGTRGPELDLRPRCRVRTRPTRRVPGVPVRPIRAGRQSGSRSGRDSRTVSAPSTRAISAPASEMCRSLARAVTASATTRDKSGVHRLLESDDRTGFATRVSRGSFGTATTATSHDVVSRLAARRNTTSNPASGRAVSFTWKAPSVGDSYGKSTVLPDRNAVSRSVVSRSPRSSRSTSPEVIGMANRFGVPNANILGSRSVPRRSSLAPWPTTIAVTLSESSDAST